MAISLKARVGGMSVGRENEQLRKILQAQTDAIQNLATKLDTLTTKLNNDGGVTDTNYATDFATTTAAIITD